MKRMLFIHKIFSKHQAKAKPLLFIVGFALIGTAALMLTKAATPTASIEPESGTIAAGACAVSDAGASGSSAVKFGSCGGGGGLPAGVTLQDVDGGMNYYQSKGINSFPNDPNFFPISVFNETLDWSGSGTNWSPSLLDTYKSQGINGFSGTWSGVFDGMVPKFQSTDMWVITGPYATSAWGNRWTGYVWIDEPERQANLCPEIPASLRPLCAYNSQGGISAASMKAIGNAIKQQDPTRATYVQYTLPVALGSGMDEAERRAYIDAGDIVSYDWYPLTHSYSTANLWEQADAVQDVRRLANYSKPIWPFIETSEVFKLGEGWNGAHPTPQQIVAEGWNSIIGGARAIQYFNHNFCESASCPGVSGRVLADSRYMPVRTAITAFNARIKTLAPVINAQFANGYETHNGQMNVMAKYYNNQFYIFAAPRSKTSQNITFNVKSGTSVTVVDENRTIPISNGSFTDTFAGETAVHIYKIN